MRGWWKRKKVKNEPMKEKWRNNEREMKEKNEPMKEKNLGMMKEGRK